jgi:uridine kinase
MNKNIVITITGPMCSGKTVIARKIHALLEDIGVSCAIRQNGDEFVPSNDCDVTVYEDTKHPKRG